MKDLLRKMFTGWMLHEASWNGENYDKDPVACMVEACGGDVIEGNMIHLFDHWANDIQTLAPHYGLELRRRDKVTGQDVGEGEWVENPTELYIREDVPPAPSPEHWWKEGQWVEPPVQDPDEVAYDGPVWS